jgi:calcineurin-like phosphoesterase
MVGDVIGRPGRRAVRALLPGLRQEYAIDLIIANGENAAGGIGITTKTADELFESDVDVITSGNHIWAQREIIPTLDSSPAILRPLNYPQGVPGHGYFIKGEAMVVNLIGRTFIGNFDCPIESLPSLSLTFMPRLPPKK